MNYNDHTYDFSGVTIISTKTGYKFSGTRTDTGTFTWVQRKMTLQPGTYTLKLKKASVCKVGLSKPDYTPVKILAVGAISGTFTLNEATDVCMTIGFTDSGDYNEENELMIYSGTDDKPFEKYTFGASPNPSYEQPIKSAGENVNLCGEFQQGGLQLGSDGSETGQANRIRTDFIQIKASSSYIIANYNDIVNNLGVGFYDENKTFISSISGGGWLSFPYIITTPSNAKYLRTSFRNSDNRNITPDLDFKLKLEPGSIATPYSPYGMGSITDKIVNRNWLLNGKTFTPSAGGWYDQLGTATTSLSQINSNTNYYDLKANTNYTIKIDKYKNINAYQLVFIKNNAINTIVNTTNLANPVTFKPTVNMRVWLRAQIVETNVETYFDAQLELGSTANPYVPHKEQTYSIYTQQPFRSIGDVRDVFFKNTVDSPYYDENLVENGWYERHLPYIESYNNEVLPLDVYNEVGGIKYCNEKSMSTTGQFSLGASVQYIDESNWNDIPCTQSQIDILENIPSTFAGQTNVFSIDEVKAYLRAKGLKDLNTLVNN